uniref:AAA family ATPase n=1 Tax=Candidatus Scatocola faecigallinarum TaxID=2840916 RepID=UPI004027D001
MSRYALLYLISKTTNEKFLILLDEPETHFNEHWKRYFLKLLCDVLAQKDTDVFVATHSAMLVSDVKKHELTI